jgi:hypothetical protein
MTRHRTHETDNEQSETEAVAPDRATATEANGHAKEVAADERMKRAEEMVDEVAKRVGELTGRLGHGLLWLAARAREEAEDIWAEARSISRGQRP